jgi:outer membrane protein TolC
MKNKEKLRNIPLTLLTTAILLLSVLSMNAQVTKLTLDEAIDLAVKNNYEAKKARLTVQKAEAQKDEAIGNAFPTIKLNANYTNNPLKPIFFMPDFKNPGSNELVPIEVGATNSFRTAAELTQILFNSAIFTGIGTAKIAYKVQRERFKSSIVKTISSVKKSYYGVLLAKELVDVVDTVLANARRNLYVTEKMHEEGFIPEFDLIRARTSVKNVEPELLNAKYNYDRLLNLFKFNLGLNINDSIELNGEIKIDKYLSIDIDSLTTLLKDANYDLRSLDYFRQVQRRKIDYYRSDYYPALFLFGNYIYQGQSNDWNFLTAKSASVGINLSYTVFQGLKTDNRVQQAKVDYLTSIEQYNQTYDALKMQLKNSVEKLEIAQKKLNINKGNIDRARRGYQIAEIRYKEGSGSQVEINDANTALANANLNYLKAAYDYLEATIELQELIGAIPQKYVNIFDEK